MTLKVNDVDELCTHYADGLPVRVLRPAVFLGAAASPARAMKEEIHKRMIEGEKVASAVMLEMACNGRNTADTGIVN